MLAILNSLNAHNFFIFEPILMILVSKFMVHKVLFDKTYLSLGLLSPLNLPCKLNNLVSPNYLIFLGYLKTWRGVQANPHELPLDPPLHIKGNASI